MGVQDSAEDDRGSPAFQSALVRSRIQAKRRTGLYTETFSPVVRYDSLRVLLAIVAERDLELVQFDVKTAFLYGELAKELFMEIPEGLTVDDAERNVCKLNKSLYGLKQASRCWNRKFSGFLKRCNLIETADQCIFHDHMEGIAVYLALYVDDGLITAKPRNVLDAIVHSLSEIFNITLGNASIYVGCNSRETDKIVQFFSIRKLILIG